MTPPRPPGWLTHETTRRPCLLPGARWWYRRGDWKERCKSMTAPKGEPILIPCEGVGCPPAGMTGSSLFTGIGMCAMCGTVVAVVDDSVQPHSRDDIIARVKRGDFG